MRDFRTFYITWPGHPKYKENIIITEDAIRVAVQKIEMVLFTNKGDFIGDINFGADLEKYIWTTNVSADFIKDQLSNQFTTYVPELERYRYTLDVFFVEGELQDALVIDIVINDSVAVQALFS